MDRPALPRAAPAASRHARLYTEMVTAAAILHGDRARLLGFDAARASAWRCSLAAPIRRDLARGGADRRRISAMTRSISMSAARRTACRTGRFGACLMREPELVARLRGGDEARPWPCRSRSNAASASTTRSRSEALVRHGASACVAAGVDAFIVHARKAWLEGPVAEGEPRRAAARLRRSSIALKRAMPQRSRRHQWRHRDARAVAAQLEHVDGVMIGRAAYHNLVDAAGGRSAAVRRRGALRDRRAAVEAFMPYVERSSPRACRCTP